MSGSVGLPQRVFPYYRQVKNGTLVIGLVGLAVTLGNMFVPKPAALDDVDSLTPHTPATSQQSPWDKQLAPSTTTRPTQHPKTPRNNPFAGSGDGGVFGGGGNGGVFSGGAGDGDPFSTKQNQPGSGPFGN